MLKKERIPELLLEFGELSMRDLHDNLWGSYRGTTQQVYKLAKAGVIKRSKQGHQPSGPGAFESFWVHHTRQRPPERMQSPTPYTKRENNQRWRRKVGEVLRVRERVTPPEQRWLQGLLPVGKKSLNYLKGKNMKFEFYREQVVVAHQYPAPMHGSEKLQGVGVAVTKSGDHRWRLIGSNGRSMANDGRGYKRIGGMLKSLRTIYGDSVKRCRELDKALKEFEKAHGDLAKPFKFYTAEDKQEDMRV